MGFPDNFIWGAAASSYQVEGAWDADGKGLSVWDVFCTAEGKVYNGDTGAVACDHYHRYAEDVALMAEIGLQAYRFSINWPRVLPAGVGQVNAPGLDFYDRLVDTLLAAHITPHVTLFHWDFPYALYLRGGWLNRDVADWFAEFTTVIVDRLSDRVQYWMPLNEPMVFAVVGHEHGRHAPGLKLDQRQMLHITHNILRAQGKSTQVIRARAQTPPLVGLAQSTSSAVPASDSPADIEAARRAMFEITAPHLWNQSWWLDPVFKGDYPDDGKQVFAQWLPDVRPGDMDDIHQPLDWLGINNYFGNHVRAGDDGAPEEVPMPAGAPLTMCHWRVMPEGLYWLPRFLYERYNAPIIITENGLSCHDWAAVDGHVHDPARIDFVHRYLRQLQRASEDGVEILGYFYWSIFDNFEWGQGYLQRFGMIHVDFDTQKRTIKDSARWYSKVIASNGALLAQGTE
jgi:beta-glucosidase